MTVSWTDGGNTYESKTSAPTTLVDNVNDNPGGTVTINGVVEEGKQLTVMTSLSDVDGIGEFSYQWIRDDEQINGATGLTYTLVQDDVGAEIKVTVSWTDGGNTYESKTSAGTSVPGIITDANSNEIIQEGASKNFKVKLATVPAADVIIKVTSSDSNVVIIDSADLTFNSGNWSTNQIVKVTGKDNTTESESGNATITIGSSSGDSLYNNLSAYTYTFTVLDDDKKKRLLDEKREEIKSYTTGVDVSVRFTVPTFDPDKHKLGSTFEYAFVTSMATKMSDNDKNGTVESWEDCITVIDIKRGSVIVDVHIQPNSDQSTDKVDEVASTEKLAERVTTGSFDIDEVNYGVPEQSSVTTRTSICIMEGQDVLVDKRGFVKIEDVKDGDVINGNNVVSVICQKTNEKLIKFNQGCFGNNVPNKDVYVTNEHLIGHPGTNQVTNASEYLGNIGITSEFGPSNNIYSILVDGWSMLNVNNLQCETLCPFNNIAKKEYERKDIHNEFSNVSVDNAPEFNVDLYIDGCDIKVKKLYNVKERHNVKGLILDTVSGIDWSM